MLAEALDEASERLGRRRPRFRDGVDEHAAEQRNELSEVRDEVLGRGEGRHVADDRGRLALDVGAALAESTVQNGDDLKVTGFESTDAEQKQVMLLTRASDEESMK